MTLVYGNQKIVDELNKLDFENKRLREENKRLKETNEKVQQELDLREENERLKETNEKLQRELDKTREDLNYFKKLKVGAMKVDSYGHDRCYVTSMQKKR